MPISNPRRSSSALICQWSEHLVLLLILTNHSQSKAPDVYSRMRECACDCKCNAIHFNQTCQIWIRLGCKNILGASLLCPKVVFAAQTLRTHGALLPFLVAYPYLPELAWTSLLAKFPSPLHKTVGILFSCACSSFARSWKRPCQRQHAQGMPTWARSA